MTVRAQIGPCQFGQVGRWVTVRCPRDLEPLMRRDRIPAPSLADRAAPGSGRCSEHSGATPIRCPGGQGWTLVDQARLSGRRGGGGKGRALL